MGDLEDFSFAGTGSIPASGPARWMDIGLTVAIAVLVFALMAVTFIDVVGRYFFDSPIPGTFEVVSFLLALLVFSGLPLVTRDERHITVTLMEGLFKGWRLWFQKVVVSIASAAVLGFIAERLWRTADDMAEMETLLEYFDVPFAYFVYFMAALSFLSFLLMLPLIWHHARSRPGRRDSDGPIRTGSRWDSE